MRRVRGSLLIEILVATGIAAVGLVAVILAFIDVNRSAGRTNLSTVAINVIQSQIDQDSRVTYSQIQDDYPPITQPTSLPNATLTRQVTVDSSLLGSVKHIRYFLQWSGDNGVQTMQSEYEITDKGLDNG